jgi:hypothetical protein
MGSSGGPHHRPDGSPQSLQKRKYNQTQTGGFWGFSLIARQIITRFYASAIGHWNFPRRSGYLSLIRRAD